MTIFLLMILAFPVLLSANIVIPIERTIVMHDDQHLNNTPSFPLKKHTHPLFYTLKVRLGTPSKEFTLQIDTGSDDLWVSCKSNSGCPSSSKHIRDATVFDPATSSTASLLPCSDKLCSHCSHDNQCTFDTRYLDNDTNSGYYLKDMLFFDKEGNSSAPFVFGCSTYCSGVWSSLRLDGIIGLRSGGTSFVSQLSAAHKIPRVFSHCLMGDGGGGALVFGNINESSIVYTPIDPSPQFDYIINVDSIFVGEKELSIAAENSKVIVDSGTTSGVLVKEIYDLFFDAINETAAKYTTPNKLGKSCFNVATNVDRTLAQIFPTLTYTFKGGLTIVLRPEEYLSLAGIEEGQYKTWCVTIAQESENIIGDIFFRDKIVVYDYDQKRIGMANYDCSLLSASSILHTFPLQLYVILAILLIMHIL